MGGPGESAPDRSRRDPEDTAAPPIDPAECGRTRSTNNSYDGDNSDTGTGNDDGDASDTGWTPVVKFAEEPKSPISRRAQRSGSMRAYKRTQSAVGLNDRPHTTSAGSMSARLRGSLHHRRRQKSQLAAAAARGEESGELNSVHSFPALSSLGAEGGLGPGMTPLNTPAPITPGPAAAPATRHLSPSLMPVAGSAGRQRQMAPLAEERRRSMSIRSVATPSIASARGEDFPHDAPAIPLGGHGYPLYSTHGLSDDSNISESPHSSDSSASGLEEAWFQRARTFSVINPPGSEPPVSGQPPESIHTLPRVTTITSAREKDGGTADAEVDDLPPLGFGREVTNDLRNIQLTFSHQGDEKNHNRNPLRRLVRSKHNFRALVTYGGYLIPINILLNVILLDRGWLQTNETNKEGERETLNNPIGYLITSVISLVLIVASGLCFVLRCLEFDVILTTTISICANFINAVLILASAIMYLKTERPQHPEARLTGEYYCSYAGAAVALLNALLLLLDILITPGFRFRGSGMSRQQRLLQFTIILIVVWIGIGGYAWSKIEDWDTISSVMFCMITVTTIGVMFCMITVTTIGFGNLSPTKTYSRILQLIYGPLGILMFGLMLLNTRNVVIQITRHKFLTARRDFEAKRNRIEQELATQHVKRRLAARPPRRSWGTVVTDMLGRVFLSHNERGRIGIPKWLRRKIEEEDDGAGGHSGDIDLEAGGRHDPMSPSTNGNPAISAPEGGAPLSALSEQHNITFAVPGTNESSLHSRRRRRRTSGSDSEDSNSSAPHSMERTYTTASRLSHVRDVLGRPKRLRGARRRVGPQKREADSEDVQSGDFTSEDSDASESGLEVSQTIQPDDSSTVPKPRRMERVMTAASNMKDRVLGREDPVTGEMRRRRRRRGPRDVTKQLWVALVINITFWLASAAIFYACERAEWSYFDAMWFCYVAFTTIGYGDIVPQTTEGMVTFICLCFIAVGLETFLVVSSVSFFTDLLSRTMKRTHVQKRIARHRKGLAAYEIRRHIKHPNYNPFSVGDDEHVVKVAARRLRRSLHHAGQVILGRRSIGGALTRHLTQDQRDRDERLTEGFIRHTTGMGGFAATSWQPPSRTQSIVSARPSSQRNTTQSMSAFPSHSNHPHHTVSVPPPDRNDELSSVPTNRTASISSAPDDILWAFF
ncbi:Potassium channel [Coemansia sp. RSA 552]|nr:Potassium channel [Coemansia sp. RSA 552]